MRRLGIVVIAIVSITSQVFMASRAFACQVEMGTVTVASTYASAVPTEVPFSTNFSSVPAVFLLTTASGGNPCAMRLYDVTTSDFEVACVEPEPEDGPHIAQDVTYVAIPTGACNVEGHDFEVECHDISAIQHGTGVPGTEGWDSILFRHDFAGTAPMVLAEIQTDNSGGLTSTPADASCPWLTVAAQNLTATGIDFALERSEVDDGCDGDVAAETVCYLAVENGSITFEADGGNPGDPSDDVTCQFQNSVGSIVGWDDGCTNVSISAGTAPISTGFKVTHAGGDGGWLRVCSSTATTISLVVDEDEFNDSERNHTAESVSVMACSDSFEVTATTDVTIVDVRSVSDPDAGSAVEWTTKQERNTLGFIVLSEAKDKTRKPIHQDMVRAAFDSLHGQVYRVPLPAHTDTSQPFWIREFHTEGTTDHGPFVLQPPTSQSRPLASKRATRTPTPVAFSLGNVATGLSKTADTSGTEHAVAVNGVVGALVDRTGLQGVAATDLAGAFGVSPGEIETWAKQGTLCAGRKTHVPVHLHGGAATFYAAVADSPIVGKSMHRIKHAKDCSSITSTQTDPTPLPSVAKVMVHLRHERNLVPVTAARPRTANANQDDFWYWRPFFASGKPEDDIVIDIPDALTHSLDTLTLTPLLRGMSNTHHKVEVWLGATRLGVLEGNGFDELSGTFALTAEQAKLGKAIRFVARKDTNAPTMGGGFIDRIDWRFAAAQPPVNADVDITTTFRSETDGALVLPAPDIATLTDITESPVPIKAVDHKGNHLGAVIAKRDYRLDLVSAAHTPTLTTIAAKQPAREATYWVIGPEVWRAPMMKLIAYRQSQGLSAKFASLESIFMHYANGDRDPQAIGQFLQQRWDNDTNKPRYVVLVGSGHFDYFGRLEYGKPILPPVLFGTQDGIFASDTAWGDVVGGDFLPEIAIGRFPVSMRQELDTVLDKIIGYDERPQPSTGNALLISDNRDRAGNFARQNQRISKMLRSDTTIVDVSLEETSIDDARGKLATLWSPDIGFVNYVGHGAPDRFAAEGLLLPGDISNLPASTYPPFVAALSCWINRFDAPGVTSLGQTLLSAKQRGAVAVWASGAISTDAHAHLLNRYFLEASADENTRVGDALIVTYQRYGEAISNPDMPATYHLLGDPATKLSLPVAPQALPPGKQPQQEETSSGGCSALDPGAPLAAGVLVLLVWLITLRKTRTAKG